jgi:hypothetical protein
MQTAVTISKPVRKVIIIAAALVLVFVAIGMIRGGTRVEVVK